MTAGRNRRTVTGGTMDNGGVTKKFLPIKYVYLCKQADSDVKHCGPPPLRRVWELNTVHGRLLYHLHLIAHCAEVMVPLTKDGSKVKHLYSSTEPSVAADEEGDFQLY